MTAADLCCTLPVSVNHEFSLDFFCAPKAFSVPMSHTPSNLHGIIFGLTLSFFAAFQQFKLPVVLPVLLDRYGYDVTLAGGFMSIYAVAGLLFSLSLGRAIERHGPAVLILAGLALFALGSLLALVFPASGVIVLLGRGLEGVAFAVMAIAGPVLANTNASVKALPVVVGLTATWIPMGQISATLLAPLALATMGWQLLWVVAIAGSALFALWTLVLRRRRPELLRSRAPSPKKDPEPQQVRKLTAKQIGALILGGALFMLWSGQYFAYMTWLPEYLVVVHEFEMNAALWGYLIPVLFVAVFCVVTGVLLRMGVSLRSLLIFGLFTQLIIWWLLPVTGDGWTGLLSLVVYGIGAGIVPTCLFSMPSVVVGQGPQMPRAFAVVMIGRNLGVLFGPILLAGAFQLSGSWDIAAPLFGGITTLGWALAIFMALKLDLPGLKGRSRPAAVRG